MLKLLLMDVLKFVFFFQTVLAEQQRDEALSHVKALKEKLEQVNISSNSTSNYRASDLRGLPLPKLKNIQVSVAKTLLPCCCKYVLNCVNN